MLCEDLIHPSRRYILGAAGTLFAWSFMPRIASASGGRDPRFITIVLRGALDGLSAVPPIGDPHYASLREGIALAAGGPEAALPLDGFFALHPAMPNLARLYAEKQALVVHASATGYRERSHFDGQDVLESGMNAPGHTDTGWLNRALSLMPEGEMISRAGALGVGAITPLVVRGKAPVIGWAPQNIADAGTNLSERVLSLYQHTDKAMADVLAAGLRADELAGKGKDNGRGGPSEPGGMRIIAQGAARLMAKPDGPRIAALAFEGWDTHANEGGATGQLARRLSGLDAALADFKEILGQAWKDTVIAVVTEFGRTASVNGSGGSDHGTGTVTFLAGGAVKGGRIIADWPGLKPGDLHEQRDLKATVDLRAVLKGVLVDHLGIGASLLAEEIFPQSSDIKPLQDLIRS